jgi:anthranilate synthase component 1
MQGIAALEPAPRDVYTGAIGYFDAAGGLDLSIAIRTAVLREGTLHLHVGGGIVADSDPAAEWLETDAKLAAFRELWDLRA